MFVPPFAVPGRGLASFHCVSYLAEGLHICGSTFAA